MAPGQQALIGAAGPVFAPVSTGVVSGIFGIVALPVSVGTALVILVNQPMPGSFVAARAAEAAFWLFAAVGALVGKRNGGTAGTASLYDGPMGRLRS